MYVILEDGADITEANFYEGICAMPLNNDQKPIGISHLEGVVVLGVVGLVHHCRLVLRRGVFRVGKLEPVRQRQPATVL